MADDPKDNDQSDASEKSGDQIDASKRRLFRHAIYIPPIVIGAVILNDAGCGAPASCNPSTCNPNQQCGPNTCNPVINPCGPQSCNPAN